MTPPHTYIIGEIGQVALGELHGVHGLEVEVAGLVAHGTCHEVDDELIGLNNIMRATGYPRKAMISALLSVAVNVVMAPIFIFKLHWGISGATLSGVSPMRAMSTRLLSVMS